MIVRFFSLTFLILFIPYFAIGAQSDVIINEVAWMGTSTSTANEWIELYNGSGNDIDLNGWTLDAQDGSPNIKLSGRVLSKGFFLLERTDDETISDIKADQIYTGALSNSGEILILTNDSGQEIDRLDGSKGWQAGDVNSKKTMQRDGDMWLTRESTPRKANHLSSSPSSSSALASPRSPVLEEPTSTKPSALPIPQQEGETLSLALEILPVKEFSVKQEPVAMLPGDDNLWSRVYISEFLPNPEGPDEKEEWIELYNDDEKDILLEGIALDDDEGGSRPYAIPKGTIITSKGFFVFPRSETKVALNTSDDAVRLLTAKGRLISRVRYDKAKENEAAALDMAKGGFYWTRYLTKGKENAISKTTLIATEVSGSYKEDTVKSLDELSSIDVRELGAGALSRGLVSARSGSNAMAFMGIALLFGAAIFAVRKVLRKFSL